MTLPRQSAEAPDPLALRVRVWAKRLASVAVALLGFKYGYDFGEPLGGLLLGIAMGLNAAVFSVFMATSLASFLARGARIFSQKSDRAP